MAIPHASIARLSSFMMLLDPDPAGEITASLSRDRGMGDVVRRNLDGSVAAIPVVRAWDAQRGSARRRLSACSESKSESSGQVYTVEEGPDGSRFT